MLARKFQRRYKCSCIQTERAVGILEGPVLRKRNQFGAGNQITNFLKQYAEFGLTIPVGGTGKISYEVAGSRFSAPARALSGTEIRQGATVVIRERDGQVFVVVAK